jgi:hypothetical protein
MMQGKEFSGAMQIQSGGNDEQLYLVLHPGRICVFTLRCCLVIVVADDFVLMRDQFGFLLENPANSAVCLPRV